MKNFNDTIGNRTRDLPIYSAVPQPTAPPRAPDTNCTDKAKAVPLQVWIGPEGSRNLRFPYFTTTAQDGGKVVSLTHRPPLLSGNIPGTHFC